MSILQDLRKIHGEQQADVAALLDMSPGNYCGYERGIRPLTERHINILCDHYGVSADYLLGRYVPPEMPVLPDGLTADMLYQLTDAIPAIGCNAGDIALVMFDSDRNNIPADCYVLVDDSSGRRVRHYIRHPGVELLYNGDKAEIWTLNGDDMLNVRFVGYVTYVLKSV